MLPIRRRQFYLKTAPFLTTNHYIMSTFLLNTVQAGLETNGVTGGTAAAPADAVTQPGGLYKRCRTTQPSSESYFFETCPHS